MTDDALTLAGQRALKHALDLFSYDIIDPKRSDHSTHAEMSRAHIDAMLRAVGWEWEIPYKGDGQVEWCGIFAGTCWRAAGIDPKWLRTYFPSTYRLDCWGRYQAFDKDHPNPKPADKSDLRLMVVLDAHSTALPFEPRAGDIVMVGDGTPPMGDHITLCERYDAATRTFTTISGNGGGLSPAGNRRQGVVRADFKVGGAGYCVRRVIRPAFGDLMAERAEG